MDDDESGGLFDIAVSPHSSPHSSPTAKLPRDHQSEAEFQRQKSEWVPRVEVGEIWKSIGLPVDDPSKAQAQNILHAIEELYFGARYEEAERVAVLALKGRLEGGFRRVLLDYRERCRAKVEMIRG